MKTSAVGRWLVLPLLSLGLGCSALGTFFGIGEQEEGAPPATLQAAAQCVPADPNALRFSHALCLCENLDKVGYGVSTSSFRSLGFGRGKPTDGLAHVGVNGNADSVGAMKVDGNLTVAGAVDMTANILVTREMRVGKDLAVRGHFTVEQDAWVKGNLTGVGKFDVAGKLSVGGEISHRGNLSCDDVQTQVVFDVPPPCACGADQILDVAKEVAAHATATPVTLHSGAGDPAIVLTTGEYYAADGAFLKTGPKLRIDGNVKLYIQGDVDMLGHGILDLGEDSQLDLYIAGSVKKVGKLVQGEHPHATASRSLRLYIGGNSQETEVLQSTGQMVFEGAIYAPRADILYTGNVVIRGSVFAKNLIGRGHFLVMYDADITGSDEPCDQVPGEDNNGASVPGTSSGSGSTPDTTDSGTSGTGSGTNPTPDADNNGASTGNSGTGAGTGTGTGTSPTPDNAGSGGSSSGSSGSDDDVDNGPTPT